MGYKTYGSERNFIKGFFNNIKIGSLTVCQKIIGSSSYNWYSYRKNKVKIIDGSFVQCEVSSNMMPLEEAVEAIKDLKSTKGFEDLDISNFKVSVNGKVLRALTDEEKNAIKKMEEYDARQAEIQKEKTKKRKAQRDKERRELEKAQKARESVSDVATALAILKEKGLNVVVVKENGVM
jgi:hypothetical protein